jgi:hypothetical protein
MTFCHPEISGKYWLTKLNLRCSKCATKFEVLLPRGDDIVKLREAGGHTIKWLPMYGVGGYLDLLWLKVLCSLLERSNTSDR